MGAGNRRFDGGRAEVGRKAEGFAHTAQKRGANSPLPLIRGGGRGLVSAVVAPERSEERPRLASAWWKFGVVNIYINYYYI